MSMSATFSCMVPMIDVTSRMFFFICPEGLFAVRKRYDGGLFVVIEFQ